MKSILCLFTILFLSLETLCTGAPADLNSKVSLIARDLRPILGHIQATGRDSVVIDLGARHGVRTGDLFSVYIKDGRIPLLPLRTRAFSRELAGILQVKDVEGERAICAVVKQHRVFPEGAEVERFSGLKAVVLSDPAIPCMDLGPVTLALKEGLWWLDWEDYDGALASPGHWPPEADLAFVVSPHGIKVFARQKQPVRSYEVDLSCTVHEKNLARITNRPETPVFTFSPVGELSFPVRQVAIGACGEDKGAMVFTLTLKGVYLQRYGREAVSTILEEGVPFVSVTSIDYSCELGLLAVNKFEDGVGYHSLLIRVDYAGEKVLEDDVNLRFGFGLTGRGQELLGQAYDAGENEGHEGVVFRLAPGMDSLTYLESVNVPGGFFLDSGKIARGYAFFVDRRRRWVASGLSGGDMVSRKDITIKHKESYSPLFQYARAISIEGRHGILVPLFNRRTRTSYLYFIPLDTLKARRVSGPMDGRVVGMDMNEKAIYVAITRGEKGALLLRADFKDSLATRP